MVRSVGAYHAGIPSRRFAKGGPTLGGVPLYPVYVLRGMRLRSRKRDPPIGTSMAASYIYDKLRKHHSKEIRTNRREARNSNHEVGAHKNHRDAYRTGRIERLTERFTLDLSSCRA